MRMGQALDRTRSLAPASAAWLTLAVVLCTPGRAESALKHGVVWYTTTTNSGQVSNAASRYDVGVTGKELPPANMLAIKLSNPSFRWFVYNSGSDNYVPPNSQTGEHDALVAKATARGWDIEECYLHFYDDTRIVLEGDTLTIPGWGGGSAANPALARVPVYYKTLVRRVINTSTGRARQLHKEVFVAQALDTPFTGTSLYADGIFLDNSTTQIFNYGTIVSGGHVREATGHPLLGSSTFQTWYWNQNYGPFLTALKDTLQTSAAWSKDHQRKYLMLNIANIWSDTYVSMDAADVLFMEFEYNPVRDFGTGAVAEAFRRDRLAADAGIATFYSATMTRTVSGHTGSFSYAQTILGNLAWYLVSRTELTYLFEMGTSSPSTAGWDSLTWRGCLDVATQQLGEAVGDPYVLDQGTDPMGNPCAVYARHYENGLAVVRPRGNWNQGIETTTAITVNLPSQLYPLKPDGTLSGKVTSISLRNGEGAIFLSAPLPVQLLSLTALRVDAGAEVRWELGGGADDVAGFDVYREDAEGVRQLLTASVLSPEQTSFMDADPPAGETNYWLVELLRTGDTIWHGPTLLPAAIPEVRPGLTLSQNQPNPFRSSTDIRFDLGSSAPVLLRVLDIRGGEVARLLDGAQDAGSHTVSWNGRDARGERLPQGLYVLQLKAGAFIQSRKLVLLP